MPKPMKFQQLPVEQLDAAAKHPDTIMQQKVDGIRAVLKITNRAGQSRTIQMMAGNGNQMKSTTAKPTADRILAWAETTFGTSHDYDLTLDGEIIDGTWWVFDMPRSPRSTERTGYARRLALLTGLLSRLPRDERLIRVLPAASTVTAKQALVAAVRANGGEGVIVKHREGSYDWDGRVAHSLKAKFTHTVDCVVLARNIGPQGKLNAVLGVYQKVNGSGPLGGIPIGPTTEITGEAVEIGNCSMIGKPDAQPGDVVEVKYLYAGAGGRLVQPTLLRIRDDKPAEDCSLEQLRFVNKAVLDGTHVPF